MDKNKKQNQAGQAMVEFVLVLGALLFVVLIIIEGFRLYQQRFTLDQVARESARQAAQYGGETAELDAYIDNQLRNVLIDPAQVTVIVEAYEFNGSDIVPQTPTSNTCTYGDYISVRMEMDWDVLIPITDAIVSAASANGRLSTSHLDKCWRGS